MSTAGKICLVLTLLLLLVAVLPIPGPWGGWTPKLLVIHSEWSQKLRNVKESVRQKQANEAKARQELMKAAAQLEALAIGWDQIWRVQPGQIRNQNGQLILTELGSNQGVRMGQTKDDAGSDQVVRPIIHAFYGGAEATTYVGEFIVTDVGPNNSVLTPVPRGGVAQDEVEEVVNWNMGVPWRLRSMIPAAARGIVDEHHRHKVRTMDLIAQATKNIERQNGLLQEAQTALDIRKGELLGDPNRTPTPGRPEFDEGLLKVTEAVEEERDQLLLDVDTLRRGIKKQGEERDVKVETLQSATESLPGSSTEYDTVTTPKVASGQ